MTTALSPEQIRNAVRQKFNEVACVPRGTYRFRVGPGLAAGVGYPDSLLSSLPSASQESFTGLAYLHADLGLRPGERVLDLGCGAGLDTLVAARAVGPGDEVVGLDLAEDMIAKARALAASSGITNVRFETGRAEAMPFADDSFDVALVNGLLNLCPEKPPVARELHRVLRGGGRAVVAEITFGEALSPAELRSTDDWFR